MSRKSFSFIVSEYISTPDGRLEPRLPDRCPEGIGSCSGLCKISIHCWRARKTGPGIPLAIITCETHGGYLTVYPPGYGRYLRKPLVDRPLGGGEFEEGGTDGDVDDEKVDKTTPSCFLGTTFEAAYEAAMGVAWERKSYSTTGRWWQTQRRWLDECCRLLGVHPAIEASRVRESFAQVLDVPQMVLEKARAEVIAEPGYRSRGRAVEAVLESVPRICLAERLTLAGHIAGLWGCPYWWDGDIGRLSPAPFQQPGTSWTELWGKQVIGSMNSRR